MDADTKPRLSHAALAVGGPLVIGVVIGMPGALVGMLHGALVVPAVIAGVAFATFPALYILTTMADVAPPAAQMLAGASKGARNGALCCLGLAAPAAFLVASSHTELLATVLGLAILGFATIAASTAFWRALYAEDTNKRRTADAAAIFALWTFVAVAIGGRFLFLNLAG